jgi:5-hmdU DNA kinase, helical domain
MLTDLLHFIKERHSIYLKRQKGLPKPWTSDPILQTYKFCNVYRELDTVTIWIRKNIREPYAKHPNLWFMLCVARQINWPDTLQELMDKGAWPTKSWDAEKACRIMIARQESGKQTYTGAYILRADRSKTPKPNYTCKGVLEGLWKDRAKISKNMHGTLADAHAALMQYDGWGSFLAAQVIADLKHTPRLINAPDWLTWAASGPGSKRGLNRVLGRPVNNPWKEEEWLKEAQKLNKEIAPHLKKWGYPRLHAQDWQNVLCEVDKYIRVKNGEGKPRSLYNGKG